MSTAKLFPVLLLYLNFTKDSQAYANNTACAVLYSEENLGGESFSLSDQERAINLEDEYRHRAKKFRWNITNSIQVGAFCTLDVCSKTNLNGLCLTLTESNYLSLSLLNTTDIRSAFCKCQPEEQKELSRQFYNDRQLLTQTGERRKRELQMEKNKTNLSGLVLEYEAKQRELERQFQHNMSLLTQNRERQERKWQVGVNKSKTKVKLQWERIKRQHEIEVERLQSRMNQLAENLTNELAMTKVEEERIQREQERAEKKLEEERLRRKHEREMKEREEQRQREQERKMREREERLREEQERAFREREEQMRREHERKMKEQEEQIRKEQERAIKEREEQFWREHHATTGKWYDSSEEMKPCNKTPTHSGWLHCPDGDRWNCWGSVQSRDTLCPEKGFTKYYKNTKNMWGTPCFCCGICPISN